MIDELSLGLAPLVVEQLLDGREAVPRAGHHRDPRRAVGERRAHHRRQGVLHGEGRDPVPRPHRRSCSSVPTSCGRSSSRVPRRPTGGRSRGEPTQGRDRSLDDRRDRAARSAVARERSASGAWCSRPRASPSASPGSPRSTTCRSSSTRARSSASSGPNGAGKTTLFDLISGFLAPRRGHGHPRGQRRHPAAAADAAPSSGSARSFQDARLFGALTVHQAICVALDRPHPGLGPGPRDALLPERRARRAPARRSGPTSSSR